MIYLINFIWQLLVFIIGDILSYTFLLRPAFRGHNHYSYYRNQYGVVKSGYNGGTIYLKWYKGKYNALFGLNPIRV